MKHNGKVEKGNLIFDDPENFLIQKAKLEGKRVVVELKQYRKNRSNNQNAYIWGVVVKLITEYTGDRDNESKQVWEQVKIKVGHVYTEGFLKGLGKPTKDLTTVEFEDLASRIRTWANCDLGIYIPLPNESEMNYL